MDLAEAWDSEQVWERDMRIKDEQGNDHIGVPIKFSHEPGKVRFDLPRVGQHSSHILKELGYSDNEISTLADSGVIKVE